jgi:hypothetical protein
MSRKAKKDYYEFFAYIVELSLMRFFAQKISLDVVMECRFYDLLR